MQTSSNGHSVAEGSPYTRHLPALDGVRGFAVLGVACSHLFPGTPHSSFQGFVHNAFAFGATGVDLFFVLSGFLITGILYDSLPDPGFFRKFYARRVLRIFPLYYGVLAVFAVAALIFGLNFHHQLLSLALYLQNTNLIAQPIRDYLGPTYLPLPHFWSLAIEEQFYLVWPVTVFLLRTRQRLLVFCAAALLFCPFLRAFLLLHGVNYNIVNSNTLCRSDSLLAGAALALLFRSRLHDRVLRAAAWIFLAGAVSGVLLFHASSHGPFFNTPTGYLIFLAFYFSSIALASVGVIALSLRSPLVSRLCTRHPMRWLGKYSYGIYVLHLILFFYLDDPLRHFFSTHLTPDKGADILITGVLIFLLSLIAAYLSYHLYEKHFLRLKRYFDYRPHPNTVS
ncbi:MAG: acyltransferase [Acidobacteriaceae bacterium]|jgi:peptidoglycan/LPS O-acetylase OafA/YrhL